MSLAGTTYQPYLFTLLDARQIRSDLSELQKEQHAPFYFVSVTGQNSTAATKQDEKDDVEALSYDTIAYNILRALKEAGVPSDFATPKAYRTAFRNEFKVLMSESDKLEGSLTGMAFAEFSNTAVPNIYAVEADTLTPKNAYAYVNPFDKLRNKVSMVHARFGMFPWFCVFLILAIVVGTSMLDLIRWYEGEWLNLLKHKRTYYLLSFHFVVSFALYVVLAETGKVAYNNMTTTILIALAPTYFFRSKIIEMPGGQTLGFIKFYDRILQWLNEGLMVTKFKDVEGKVELVVHYNSQKGLEEELRALYGNARNPQQRLRLISDLENHLESIPDTFDRRKYCTRLLLQRLDWKELRKRRLVPDHMNEDQDIKGPLAWIRESERYCLKNSDAMAKLERVVTEKRRDELSESDKTFLDNKIKDDDSLRGRLFSNIRFLVLTLGYDQAKLKAEGLLPPDDQPQTTSEDEPRVIV